MSTPYALNFSYTASGGISQMKLGNWLWETAKFNTRMQVTELGLGHSATNAGLWKVNYDYGELNTDGTVNAAKNTGNIAKQTLTIPGTNFVQSYKYDSLYRLTEAKETTGATQNWIQNWNYDRYGNRTTFSQDVDGVVQNTTPAIDANTNRFVTAGTNFQYDLNGNLVRDGEGRQFTFNGDNKQTQVRDSQNNVIGTYYFDGEGKRVKKIAGGETTIFVYSSGKLIAEYSTQLSQNPTISYTTTDHLGSPRIITDTTGNVKSRRDFMPFGEDLFNGVGARSASLKYSATGDDIKQKFTGYLKDTETGLDFAEARMYENRHGRFTAVDPLLASGKSANPQTFNRYVYVGNSPVVVTDPTGMIGDYFSRSGKYLGNDGKKDDGLIYFATETRHDDRSTYIDQDSIVKTTLEEVIKAQNQAVPLTPGVDNTIQEVAQEVTQGVIDGGTGIAKGVGNAQAVALNGVTSCIFNCGVQGSYFQGSNPLAVPLPFSYNNAREASYGSASSFGTIAGFGTAAGTIFGGSSMTSVVPEGTVLPRYLYTYTSPSTATTIQRAGQIGRTDELVYATDVGNLTPLRAQLDLALPQSNSAQSVFRIDTSLINQQPLIVRPVTGNVFSRPGGGTEYIFRRPFPSGSFTRTQ